MASRVYRIDGTLAAALDAEAKRLRVKPRELVERAVAGFLGSQAVEVPSAPLALPAEVVDRREMATELEAVRSEMLGMFEQLRHELVRKPRRRA